MPSLWRNSGLNDTWILLYVIHVFQNLEEMEMIAKQKLAAMESDLEKQKIKNENELMNIRNV